MEKKIIREIRSLWQNKFEGRIYSTKSSSYHWKSSKVESVKRISSGCMGTSLNLHWLLVNTVCVVRWILLHTSNDRQTIGSWKQKKSFLWLHNWAGEKWPWWNDVMFGVDGNKIFVELAMSAKFISNAMINDKSNECYVGVGICDVGRIKNVCAWFRSEFVRMKISCRKVSNEYVSNCISDSLGRTEKEIGKQR